MARNLDTTTLSEVSKNNTYPVQLVRIKLQAVTSPTGEGLSSDITSSARGLIGGVTSDFPTQTEIDNIGEPLGPNEIPVNTYFDQISLPESIVPAGSTVVITISEDNEDDIVSSFFNVQPDGGFYIFDRTIDFTTQTIVVASILAADLDSTDQSVYLTTAYQNINYNDPTLFYDVVESDGTVNNTTANIGTRTYTAAGGLLSLAPVEETQDVKANAISIRLAGVPNTLVTVLESNRGQVIGGEVTIHQAFWDEDNGQLTRNGTTDEPAVYKKWEGIIYSTSVDEENTRVGDVNITVECKNRIGIILDTKSGRFTSENSFQQFNNDDKSMEFVPTMVSFNPQFGREN